MSKSRKVVKIVLNGINIKIKNGEVYNEHKKYSYCIGYNGGYVPLSFECIHFKNGRIANSSNYRLIYNYDTGVRIYFKPTKHTIEEYILAIKEAEEHKWPNLNCPMKAMGLKCNYFPNGFRVQILKTKKGYKVTSFKHKKLEPNWRKRKGSQSQYITYDEIKDVIDLCKVEML